MKYHFNHDYPGYSCNFVLTYICRKISPLFKNHLVILTWKNLRALNMIWCHFTPKMFRENYCGAIFLLSPKKYFVKSVISLLKTLLSRKFCQKSLGVFRNFHTYIVHSNSAEIAEIFSHTFFTKISWKQWFYYGNY